MCEFSKLTERDRLVKILIILLKDDQTKYELNESGFNIVVSDDLKISLSFF